MYDACSCFGKYSTTKKKVLLFDSHSYIYIYICVCVCVFVCACLSVYIYIYIYIYMHVCVYIHIHTTKQKYLATLKNFILIKQVRHHSGLIHYTKYMHIIKYKLNKKKNSNILNFWFIKMVLFGRYHCFADSWHSFQPLLWSGDLWLFTLVYPTPVQWDLSPLIEPAKASVYLWLSLLVCFGWLSCVSTNPWATSRVPNGSFDATVCFNSRSDWICPPTEANPSLWNWQKPPRNITEPPPCFTVDVILGVAALSPTLWVS